MFKEVLNHSDLSHWAEAGLIVFFSVFVGVTVWSMTRSRKLVRQWAMLPLEDSSVEKEVEQ